MKQLQRLTLAMLAIALGGLFGTSASSATVLEVGGAAKTEAVAVKASLEGSLLLTDTAGELWINTCKRSTVHGTTTAPFTGSRVGGPISTLTFEECTEDAKEKVVVDAAGYLEVENIAGTTNGTVFSKIAKVTTPSPFGKLTCTTSATGTDIGKLTGVKAGQATVDISAVLNCGAITAKWSGRYSVTSPEGLGVAAAATTLEVGGIVRNESVTATASSTVRIF